MAGTWAWGLLTGSGVGVMSVPRPSVRGGGWGATGSQL